VPVELLIKTQKSPASFSFSTVTLDYSALGQSFKNLSPQPGSNHGLFVQTMEVWTPLPLIPTHFSLQSFSQHAQYFTAEHLHSVEKRIGTRFVFLQILVVWSLIATGPLTIFFCLCLQNVVILTAFYC
jgi:hypothetical protein